MAGTSIAYFFLGFVAGLIIVEYSQGNNSGGYRGSSNTGVGQVRGTEQGESHGRTVEVNDRKKN